MTKTAILWFEVTPWGKGLPEVRRSQSKPLSGDPQGQTAPLFDHPPALSFLPTLQSKRVGRKRPSKSRERVAGQAQRSQGA
jgi:hypothetical protein